VLVSLIYQIAVNMVTDTQCLHLFRTDIDIHRWRCEPYRWYLRVVHVVLKAAYRVQVAQGSVAVLLKTPWARRTRLLSCGVKGRGFAELWSDGTMQQLID
jgi:hypothetical protein